MASKVFVLKYGEQDAEGRVFFDDTTTKIFASEEAAQKHILEYAKEYFERNPLPEYLSHLEFHDTESLAEMLITLDDEAIPSFVFDIPECEIS